MSADYHSLPPSAQSRSLSQTELLLECASSARPFASTQGHLLVSLPLGSDGHQVVPVASPWFRDWLIASFYGQNQVPPGERPLRHALRTIAAQAVCSTPRETIYRRVGSATHFSGGPMIVLDIANADGEVIEISSDGWEISQDTSYAFYKSRGNLALARPERCSDPHAPLNALRSLLNLSSEQDWLRCLAWLVISLRPTGPYPILVLRGAPDSGKSTTARMLRMLLDPSTAPLLPLPARERDLLLLAHNNWVLAFDHVTRVPQSISGALCRLSTGGGFILPEPHEDRGSLLFHIQRPLLITTPVTSNDPWKPHPDLDGRMLTVEMPAVTSHCRRTEATLWRDFEELQPRLLGAICNAISTALARLDPADFHTSFRFPDAVAWVAATAPALGVNEDQVRAALAPGRPQPADPVADAVISFMQNHTEWHGSATELLAQLRLPEHPAWPRTPKGLSQRLNRARRILEAAGFYIDIAISHGRRSIRVAHRGSSAAPECATPEALAPKNQ